jgi:uncharacterized protein (DUF983 family)
MSKRRSVLYGIAYTKCPRCREGGMFSARLYSTKFASMHASCPCCGQLYEPEPGFYYGAMYVSFAINVAIFLASLFILHQLVEEVTMAMMISVILAVVVGLLPIIFRLSRILWLYIFVSYEGPCDQIPKKVYK